MDDIVRDYCIAQKHDCSSADKDEEDESMPARAEADFIISRDGSSDESSSGSDSEDMI